MIDLKGFGKSKKPYDNYYSPVDQVDLIYSFIKNRNLRNFSLLGHSLGGAIALLLSLRLINDQETNLSSIILIDAVAYPQQLPLFIRLLRTPLLNTIIPIILSAEMQVRYILKMAYYDDSKIPKTSIIKYAEPLYDYGAYHALRRTAMQLIPKDISLTIKRYSEINTKTLIIWGRYDTIVPPNLGLRLNKSIHNSQFNIIDEAGHIPHEESPKETLSLIKNFLDKVILY